MPWRNLTTSNYDGTFEADDDAFIFRLDEERFCDRRRVPGVVHHNQDDYYLFDFGRSADGESLVIEVDAVRHEAMGNDEPCAFVHCESAALGYESEDEEEDRTTLLSDEVEIFALE